MRVDMATSGGQRRASDEAAGDDDCGGDDDGAEAVFVNGHHNNHGRGLLPVPTSQPDPMMTPAPASPADQLRQRQQQQQQQTPGSRGGGAGEHRYADYLAEVASTSDVGTPGKSPCILSAPTYDDDCDDEGGDNENNLHVNVPASPLVEAAPATAETGPAASMMSDDGSGHFGILDRVEDSSLGRGVDSSSSSSADGVTMDVSAAPPPAAEFTAGFLPASRLPVGIAGQTNASTVSGIADLASGLGSSTSGEDNNPNGGEEEDEEVVASSDSAEEWSRSEAGTRTKSSTGTGTPPMPLQKERRPPSSATQLRGPLSPFSPDGRRARTDIRQQQRPQQQQQPPSSLWSLLPCRKVSVLVRVKPPGSNWDGEKSSPIKRRPRGRTSSSTDDGSAPSSVQLSLYPLLPPGAEHSPTSEESAPAAGLLSLASELSSSSMSGASQAANSLVVVNPTAFGTRIPSNLTMETARLVAEVGNIDSEDWARRYRFDDVLWPDMNHMSGSDVGAGRGDGSLLFVTRAMVCDALRLTPRSTGKISSESSERESSSIVCTLGSAGSGRSYTAFGRSGLRVGAPGRRRPSASGICDESSSNLVLDRTGVLGLLVAELLGFSRSQPVEFTVSLLEVVDDDVLRDLFRPPNAEFDLGQPRIRHPDHHGAIVQNLTEMNFKSVMELEKAVTEALVPCSGASTSYVCRGHIVASIKIRYSTALTHSGDSGKGWNHAVIQVVDLSPGDDTDADEAVASLPSTSLDAAQKRRAASIRKSLSGLRGILRGLIVQEAQRSISQSLSYRECTLTKLLQRALDSINSRAVLVACVDPGRNAYHRTIQTLNYVNRLWIKPGITAQSPFESLVKGEGLSRKPTARTLFPSGDEAFNGDNERSSKEASGTLLKRLHTSSTIADPSVLTSLVSDPRQRVATLLASSSKKQPVPRDAGDEPETATPSQIHVPSAKPALSSSAKETGDAGTFDDVLAKLDALESTPTCDHRDSAESSCLEDAITSVISLTSAAKVSADQGALDRELISSEHRKSKEAERLEEIQAQHVEKRNLATITECGSGHGSHTTSSSSSEAQLRKELSAAQGVLDNDYRSRGSDLQNVELSSQQAESHALQPTAAELSIDNTRIPLLSQELGEAQVTEHRSAKEKAQTPKNHLSSRVSSSDTALPLSEREAERKAGREASMKEINALEVELEKAKTGSDGRAAILEDRVKELGVLDPAKRGHTVNKEVIANKEENDRLEEREGALIKKLQWQLDELRAREGVVTNEKEAIARSEREELLDLQARMDKTLMQLQTLKSSSLSSMDKIKKEHAVALEPARLPVPEKDEEVTRLQKTNTEHLAKINQLSKDLSAARRSVIDNQEEAMDAMAQYEAIRLAKEEADHSLRESHARINELEQNVQAMKSRNDIDLSQSKRQALSAEDRLQKRISATEHAHAERISLLQRQIDTLSQERDELHDKNEDLVRQLAVERHMRHHRDADVAKITAALQGEVDAATNELAIVESRALSLREEKEQVEESLRVLEEDRLALEDDNRSLKNEISSVRSEIEGLNEIVFKSKVQNEDLLEQLEVRRTDGPRQVASNQKESELQAKLRRENAALKSSIKQCDAAMEAMRKEVSELRSTTDLAMTRLESKKESSETRLRTDLYQLEKALAASRMEANSALSKASAADRERLESENTLRGTVSELEEQLHQASQRLQDVNLNLQETDERLRDVLRDNDSLKEENLILRRAPKRKLEASNGEDGGSVRRTSAYYEGDVFDKLERERALRKNAEDVAVSLAQRLKADGINNDLDSDLSHLIVPVNDVGSLAVTRAREEKLEGRGTPFYPSRHSQAVEELDKLKPVVRNLESLYEMKDRSVRDLQSSLSATTSELNRYKSIALKLQQQDDRSQASARAGTSRHEETGVEGHTSYRSRYSRTRSHSSGTASPWRAGDRPSR